MNKFLEGLVGLGAEMLLKKTPYDRRHSVVPVKVISRRQEWRDGRCQDVLTVQGNARTISRVTEGTTPQGDRSEVHTHVGPWKWEISTEDWDRD